MTRDSFAVIDQVDCRNAVGRSRALELFQVCLHLAHRSGKRNSPGAVAAVLHAVIHIETLGLRHEYYYTTMRNLRKFGTVPALKSLHFLSAAQSWLTNNTR